MYLSYYKHPELQIFDPDICKTFPKFLPQIWDGFNFNNLDNIRIYKGDKLQELDERAKKMAVVMLTGQVNTDIGMGRFANREFNFYLVSPTFFQAMQKSYMKLRPVMDEPNALRDIYEDSVFIIGDRTVVFMKLKDNQYRYMEFQEQGRMAHFSDFAINDDDNGVTLNKFQDMETMTVFDFKGYNDIWTPDFVLYQQSFILFFKKYGNIDLEMLPAKRTTRKSQLIGEKVNNFMGIDVQVLDSRWFTTICRDEGFLVSGHFRLQPCKDENGEWTRKLIYINPYAKHGYHRLAPIVNIDNK